MPHGILLVATPRALEALQEPEETALQLHRRHAQGAWGAVCKANDRALRDGERLLSAYRTAQGTRLWVITEADRSSTCILLLEE